MGVRFGARLGVTNYLLMTGYTALLCLGWWAFYVFFVLRVLAKQPIGRVLKTYYLPTAVFAAGTSSSLVTLPVNLTNVKKYGVSDEVADFVLPFGAVMNLDASALAYVAYAPFVLSYVFGVPVSWTLLLAAWPAVVLFTIAAPGLPAGMGTSLWSATLFASMLGLEEPLQSESSPRGSLCRVACPTCFAPPPTARETASRPSSWITFTGLAAGVRPSQP